MPTQETLKATFLEALEGGVLPHAILIEGEKGVGKEELLLWLSKVILCKGENRPCGVCPACKKILSGNHPDVEVVRPEKKTGIGIDSIRAVKETLWLAPSEAAQKIYIIPNAGSLTVEAQNALLKSLEEPPEYARFFLTAENRGDLLETVLSRTAVYSLEAPTREEGKNSLERSFPELSNEEATLVSLSFAGNIGAAKTALENGALPLIKLAAETPSLLRKAKSYELAVRLCSLCPDRTALASYLEALKNLVGRCGVDKAAGKETPFSVSPSETVQTFELLERAQTALSQNCSPELIQSWFCLELSGIFGG